jgi:hypothetical protein
MKLNKDYELSGFTKVLISDKEKETFFEKTKTKQYLCLKKSKKQSVFLEFTDDNKLISNCLIYVFFKIDDEDYFKVSEINFKKALEKSELIKSKQKLLITLLLKSEDQNYEMNPTGNYPYGIFSFK